MIKNENGKNVNKTRKSYFHRVKLIKTDGEKDLTFFNTTDGAAGVTVFDTNWASADNTIPKHLTVLVRRLGFAVANVDGTPLTVADLNKIAASVLTVKRGDTEIYNGSLVEFVKLPMASNADSTLVADANSGPSYREIAAEEFAPNAVLKYSIHVPGGITKDAWIYSILDTETTAALQ